MGEQVIQDTSSGSSKLGVGTLMGTAVPLIQQMLIDGKVAEGGGHELKVRREPRAYTLSFQPQTLNSIALPSEGLSRNQGRNPFTRK